MKRVFENLNYKSKLNRLYKLYALWYRKFQHLNFGLNDSLGEGEVNIEKYKPDEQCTGPRTVWYTLWSTL